MAAPFDWLRELGFGGPMSEENRSNPTLLWLGTDLGIELELDARGEGLFLLFVRLEMGKLPDGYYVSHGKPCRVHLEHVISKLKLRVDGQAWARVQALSRAREHAPSHWLDLSRSYSALLRSCIDQALVEGERIFS
jgi:hypothetical protein